MRVPVAGEVPVADLVDYITARGHKLRHESRQREYSGPCPKCGGTDRLHVWRDGGARGGDVPGCFVCRQCEFRGDALTWKIDVEGYDYKAAAKSLGIAVRGSKSSGMSKHSANPKTSGRIEARAQRKADERDLEERLFSCLANWSEPASQHLARFERGLYDNQAASEFFKGRGITGQTCKSLHFGWITPSAQYELIKVPAWGGMTSDVFFPEGAIFPVMRSGKPVCFCIRRAKPWMRNDKAIRFHDVAGPAGELPFYTGAAKPHGVLFAVESILCAASIWQVSGGRIGAIALMGKDKPVDKFAADLLRDARLVIVAQDSDDQGEDGKPGMLLSKVRKYRPDAQGVMCSEGEKDPNDLLRHHGPEAVSAWMKESIAALLPAKQAVKQAASEPAMETDEEREEPQENTATEIPQENSIPPVVKYLFDNPEYFCNATDADLKAFAAVNGMSYEELEVEVSKVFSAFNDAVLSLCSSEEVPA